jgi:putative acetyltransferase
MKGETMDFEIRPMRAGDGEGINALRRMPGVFENILGIPSEKIARSEEFASTVDPLTHAFVATEPQVGSKDLIVGVAGLHLNGNPRLRHSGSVGIMVHKDYQNQGIGKALMGALLDIADNWLLLERVELSVFVDNERAIHLYETLGFEKEGIKRKAAIRNGKYEDEYMMSRIRK